MWYFWSNSCKIYDQHIFTNPDQTNPLCIDVTLNTFCTEGNTQVNAYLNSFDPNNICTNYLGDAGLSSGIPASPTQFSIEVPPGQNLVLIVHEIFSNTCQNGGGYELVLNYMEPAAIPTMGQWSIICLAFFLSIFGVLS